MEPSVGSMRPSDSGALRCAHLSAKQRHSPLPSRHSTRSLPAVHTQGVLISDGVCHGQCRIRTSY